ncbi:MAG: HAMP domain-containing histidine kinase [Peptococcaceae bacterium]|nr:HAMP domain-containing histidine kinase [Peptococcaceae bacterium]
MNQGMIRTAVLMGVLSLCAIMICLFIDPLASLVTLCLSTATITLFFLFTSRRNKRITTLCEQIDIALYADKVLNTLPFNDDNDLITLQNKIKTLTLKLHKQSLFLQSDKKSLKEFITEISRQLRIPFTSLNIVTSFLATGSLSPERHAELIDELNTLLTRTNWLITTLLKISRLDTGTAILRQDPIPVPALVEKATKPLAMLLKNKDVSLHSEGDADTSFCGDLAWSAEAVSNILKSILEYAENSRIDITYTQNTTFTQILITEDGKGFDRARVSQLFGTSQHNRTVHDLSFNTALTLSRRIITYQNGIILVDTLKSGGCRFTIKFYH